MCTKEGVIIELGDRMRQQSSLEMIPSTCKQLTTTERRDLVGFCRHFITRNCRDVSTRVGDREQALRQTPELILTSEELLLVEQMSGAEGALIGAVRSPPCTNIRETAPVKNINPSRPSGKSVRSRLVLVLRGT